MQDTPHTEEPRLLRALGIVGWDHLEPVILAALATESPLLLIGPHGSAKTLVLTRLAEALGLAHRHYNASLLNFDDLVGFPVPEQRPAGLPADARDDLGRRVGAVRRNLALPAGTAEQAVPDRPRAGRPGRSRSSKLRHRWGAMNPPPRADGARPAATLDTPAPNRSTSRWPIASASSSRCRSLGTCTRSISSTVLRGLERRPTMRRHACGARWQAIRQADPGDRRRASGIASADYVQIVAQKLAEADHPMSTRRAVQLTRNIIAVARARDRPARAPCDADASEDAFYTALRYSLPDAAWGAPVAADDAADRAPRGLAAREARRTQRGEGDPDRARRGPPHRARR